MAANEDHGWKNLKTKPEFVAAFADRPLSGDGISFVIHADGRISGRVGDLVLSGNWYWDGVYFCRSADLDGEDLGLDCELIEQRAGQMRYTRDKGNGESSIVEIQT